MLKKVSALSLLVMSMLVVSPEAFGQATFQIHPDSKMSIDGTSNRSDWTVHATEITGTVQMAQDGSAVQQVQVAVPSAKVVSQRSTIMDRLMHETLKVEEYPQITFTLTSAEAGGAAGALNATGQLTLAGVTKPIEVAVQSQRLADGRVQFKGSHVMLMSDFGIKSPSAMFGALHTGDQVTVNFEVVVAQAGGAQ